MLLLMDQMIQCINLRPTLETSEKGVVQISTNHRLVVMINNTIEPL
jgi:hypothetical protein